MNGLFSLKYWIKLSTAFEYDDFFEPLLHPPNVTVLDTITGDPNSTKQFNLVYALSITFEPSRINITIFA